VCVSQGDTQNRTGRASLSEGGKVCVLQLVMCVCMCVCVCVCAFSRKTDRPEQGVRVCVYYKSVDEVTWPLYEGISVPVFREGDMTCEGLHVLVRVCCG
jgi:hypothetical protein